MPSTVIKNFHYDPQKHVLCITFISGISYAYKAVPENVANMFKVAGSKGRYFNHFIKGHFKYRKLKNKL